MDISTLSQGHDETPVGTDGHGPAPAWFGQAVGGGRSTVGICPETAPVPCGQPVPGASNLGISAWYAIAGTAMA